MIFVFILYEPMKSRFHTTIIAKSWSLKFVMQTFEKIKININW